MRYYIALARRDPDGGFSVTFPDFPNCSGWAGSFGDVRAAAADGLAAHIGQLQLQAGALPEPSSFNDLIRETATRDCEALLIAAPTVRRARAPAAEPDGLFHQRSNDEWPEASA